jgi:hypothetical protein
MRIPRSLLLVVAATALAVLLPVRSSHAGFTHVCCNTQNTITGGTNPVIVNTPNAPAGTVTVTWNTTLFSDTTLVYGSSAPTWNQKLGLSVTNILEDVSVVTGRIQWWVGSTHASRTLDGWETEDPVRTIAGGADYFYGIAATSDTTAYVVGGGGKIYKTTDTGVTWTPQTSGVTSNLWKVEFVNESWGIAVGDSGVILHTADAGLTWTRIDGGAYSGQSFTSMAVSSVYGSNVLSDYYIGNTNSTPSILVKVRMDETTAPGVATLTNIPLGGTYDVKGVEVYRDPNPASPTYNQVSTWVVGTRVTAPPNVGLFAPLGSSSFTVTPLSAAPRFVTVTGPTEAWVGLTGASIAQWDSTAIVQSFGTSSTMNAGGTPTAGSPTNVAWVTFVGDNGTIYTSQRNTGVYYNAALASSHSVTLTLNPASNYSFYAISRKAVDPNYWQVYHSGNVYFTTRSPDLTPPSAPTGLTAASLYNAFFSLRFYVDLNWNASADAESGIAGYEVSRGASVISALQGFPGLSDRRLPYGTTYTYSVRARNGDGLWSSPVTVSATTLSPAIVTKSIGTGVGRDFNTLLGWENARNGDLAYRSVLAVTPGSSKFNLQENVTGGASAIAWVQDDSNLDDTSALSTTIAKQFTAPVTTGNLIVVSLGWGTVDQVPTVTDNQGNTYTLIASSFGGTNQGHAAYYAKNVVGGSVTVTANFSPAVAFRRLIISEYSGVDTVAPLDILSQFYQINVGTGTDAVNSGNVAVSAAGSLVYGSTQDVKAISPGGTTLTAGTGFTLRETLPGVVMGAEDRILASGGVAAATFTHGATTDTRTLVAVFKPAARCSGRYIPENQFRDNLPVMSLDGFTGNCLPGDTLVGATTGATATFNGVTSANGTIEIGEAYKDSTFTAGVTIEYTSAFFVQPTDPNHFLWLTTGPGQRHTGVAGTGVRIKLAAGGTPIDVRDSYARVHGLDIDNTPTSGFNGTGICFGYPAKFGEAAYNLIHDGDYTGICVADYVSGTKIYNNVLYKLNRVGEFGSIQVTAPRNPSGDTVYLYDNTIVNSGQRGIGFGIIGSNPLTVEARNNAVLGSTLANFGTQAGVSYAASSSNNLSGDGSAPGTASLTNVPVANLNFRSLTAGSEDLRIQQGSSAIDVAANLTTPGGFSDDLIGRNRNDTVNFGPQWDMGSYEADSSPPGTVTTTITGSGWLSGSGYYCNVTFPGTTDAQSGVASYRVYRDGSLQTTALSPTTFADVNLSPGTTYTYETRAVNGDGFERTTGNTTATCTTLTPSFSVSVSKPTFVVTIGGSGDSGTVTVTSQNGFAGTVNLTDTVPQGSGTFGSASLSVPAGGLATTTWTINPGGSMTAGDYTASVTGTSGATTASASITERVTDFSLGATSPSSATVAPGGSTTFSYPIMMTNSSSLYNYSVTGVSVPLTATISYSINPSSPYTQNGTATRTQNVTVITSATTPAGTYTINESVSYHGKTVTTPFTLTVAQPDFTFTAPASISVNQGSSANLTTTLTSLNGYSGTITYSTFGFPPPGVILTQPPAQNLTAGSTLNPVVVVNAGPTAVSGSVTIRATDGASTKSVVVNVNVVQVPDFTIEVNSSKTVTVAQGTDAVYFTAVYPTGGFAGPVTESVTFSPAGPTGTFTPQPLTSGNYNSGVLTIPTGSVTPGTYTLTITGSGTPGTRQVPGPVTLTVSSNPDFTLAANAPTSQTVAAGATATYNLTATSYVGYAGTITLSQSGIPSTTPPFTVAFTPSSLIPSTSGSPVTLTIATPYDPVGVGTFTVVVTGTDGSKTHTATVTLTVTADTTAPVITSGPTAIPDFTTATINWGTNEPADSVVEYSTDLSFSSVAALTSDVTAHSVLLSGLIDGTAYNYRVKSTNPFGLTTTSPNGTFTTLLIPDTIPPVVSFVAPASGSTQQGVITITVNATDSTSGVALVEISESGPKNPGGRVLQTLTTGGPNYSVTWDTNDPINGEDNGTVTLTARATDAAGNAAAPVSIQITLANDETPPAFVLINGLEVEVTVTVSGSTAVATIHWRTDESSTTSIKYGIEQSSGAYTYGSPIDLEDGLGNLIYGTDHLVQLTNLALNSRYHYQIKSCDASNNCLF